MTQHFITPAQFQAATFRVSNAYQSLQKANNQVSHDLSGQQTRLSVTKTKLDNIKKAL